MVGFHERTDAAARVIQLSLEESGSTVKEAAKIVTDPKVGTVAKINGVLFVATVSLGMAPLALGEAVGAFIKPPKSP